MKISQKVLAGGVVALAMVLAPVGAAFADGTYYDVTVESNTALACGSQKGYDVTVSRVAGNQGQDKMVRVDFDGVTGVWTSTSGADTASFTACADSAKDLISKFDTLFIKRNQGGPQVAPYQFGGNVSDLTGEANVVPNTNNTNVNTNTTEPAKVAAPTKAAYTAVY